jgi:hypothetical protein
MATTNNTTPARKGTGWVAIVIVTAAICIAAYVWGGVKVRGWGKSLERIATPIAISSLPGPYSVHIGSEFGGRIWNEQATIITGGHVVDKNVSWQVRYDGDDSKTFSFPPYNAPGNNVFMYTNPWTYREERVMPNPEGKTTSEYAFTRAPR